MSRLVRLAAAVALVAVAGLTGPTPAYAEPCSTASGVSVVVDFHQLGGGIEQDCVADQGTADDLFVAAGHTLQNVNNQAFVCRVDGLPTQERESCARTPPADAYWGLWWSDGEDGTWTYSSSGVYSFDVPDGGAVALSWNGSSATSPPGAPPPQHGTAAEPSAEPEPTRSPSQPPTSGGGRTGGDSASATTATTESSSSPEVRERRGRRGGGREDEASDRAPRDRDGDRDRDRDRGEAEGSLTAPTTTPTGTAVAAEPPASSDDAALPLWVGPSAVGGLLGVAGLATYLRRRRPRTP